MTFFAALLVGGSVLMWPPRRGRWVPGGPHPGSVRWWFPRPWGSRRPEPLGVVWVASLAELLALGLEAGLTPAAALTHAVQGSLLAEVVSAEAGQGAGAALSAAARHTPALAGLARAFALAERLGGPLAECCRGVADHLRAGAAAAGRAEVLAAGPRATMRLLTTLPLAGPAVAALIGFAPAELFGTPIAMAAAGVGGGFLVLGWCWARSLLRRAQRPTRVADPR